MNNEKINSARIHLLGLIYNEFNLYNKRFYQIKPIHELNITYPEAIKILFFYKKLSKNQKRKIYNKLNEKYKKSVLFPLYL